MSLSLDVFETQAKPNEDTKKRTPSTVVTLTKIFPDFDPNI